MAILPSTASSSLLDWVDDVPNNIRAELKVRYDELTHLGQEQVQMGTSIPQLYGSLSRFIANPSSVTVETYKRMVDTDEVIGSGIDFMNLAFLARFGEYKHPSKEIEKFVRRALSQMDGSWHDNLAEIFSAEWNGFSITEKVWKYEHDFDGFPAFVPQKLITYPPLTIVFAVDRHGEVLSDGIYQYQRYHNSFFNSYFYGIREGDVNGFRPDMYASLGDYPYPIRIAADLTYLTVKIPREKVIHMRSSSTGKFNNPYGRSILRKAYKHWVMKDAILKMRLIACDRKGTPLTVGYADPNATVRTGNTNQHLGVTPSEDQRADVALNNIMKTIHNSSFITLPGRKGEMYEIEAIQTQGDGVIFKDAIDDANKSMMKAMLISELIMGTGDGSSSYALATEQTKNFNRTIDGKLKPYQQGLLDQLIRPMLQYNFPVKLWERDGCGEFLLEEFDPDQMEKMSNIFGALTEKGYMDVSDQEDMDVVREKMGLPKKLAQEKVQDFNPIMDQSNPEVIQDKKQNNNDQNKGDQNGQGDNNFNKSPKKENNKEEDDDEDLPSEYKIA